MLGCLLGRCGSVSTNGMRTRRSYTPSSIRYPIFFWSCFKRNKIMHDLPSLICLSFLPSPSLPSLLPLHRSFFRAHISPRAPRVSPLSTLPHISSLTHPSQLISIPPFQTSLSHSTQLIHIISLLPSRFSEDIVQTAHITLTNEPYDAAQTCLLSIALPLGYRVRLVENLRKSIFSPYRMTT